MAERGGNSRFNTGQLVASSTPQLVPGTYQGFDGNLLRLCSTGDIYIGASAALTAANGYRVVANTNTEITSRAPVYVIAASGAPTVTYLQEGS